MGRIRMVFDKKNVLAKLKAKTFFDSSGCWKYRGEFDSHGYGLFREYRTIKHRVHRLSMWIHQDFNMHSNELVLHKNECKFKNCWNPNHLYIGNQWQNIQDLKDTGHVFFGGKGADYEKVRTHCPQGHEYTKQNTRLHNNKRSCKACNTINKRKSRS